MTGTREAIFISHASPEDDAFAIWLGAKLAAMGYEVWADVLRLKGGDDWQRKLENALRQRACKMLVVSNPLAVEKQGVRNEILIGTEVARKIGDDAFIIPLRLEPFEAPFPIAHAQYIDFSRGWTQGLSELLETLQETYRVPRKDGDHDTIWREVHLVHGKTLVNSPEELVSNWLSINLLPEKIRYYEFNGHIPLSPYLERMDDAPWPLKTFRDGLLAFATLNELKSHFGPTLPVMLAKEMPVKDFLNCGWPELGIRFFDAQSHFTDLSRQAFDIFFLQRGLQSYVLSGLQKAWWPPIDVAPTTKISFNWGSMAGLRQIQGVSLKQRMNWHFGVSITVRSRPLPHARFISRLVFTEDGHNPFNDLAKMHRLRRSFAKTWRNARWRDMLLAFLHWLARAQDQLSIPVSSNECIVFNLPPIVWQAPMSVPMAEEIPEPDDDDPTIEEESYELEYSSNDENHDEKGYDA